MDELIQIIGTTGFPIAVAIYLLYERNRAMKELTSAIVDLKVLIKSKVK